MQNFGGKICHEKFISKPQDKWEEDEEEDDTVAVEMLRRTA